MDDATADADNCFPNNGSYSAVGEDILRWAIYVDSNDIEGLRFVTENDVELTYKANFPNYFPDPPAQLLGRPIGFRIELGHTGVDAATTPNQLMKLQIIYNECICPTAFFLEDSPPSDMAIKAVVGTTQTQVLAK